MANKGEREFSQSVDNALRLLGCFADREECGISELSRELGISKASVARIVAALERGRFLSRNPETGRYRLGVGLMFFGSLVRERSELARALSPIMHAVAEKYQSTTHLAVFSGSEVLIIAKVSAGPFVYMSSRVGGSLYPHCTSTGKCLLAFMEPESARRCLETLQFEALTPRTITDMPSLLEELRLTRERGYAIDDGEYHEGLYCIGCPVLDSGGHAIAAISVSGRREALEPLQKEIFSDVTRALSEFRF